MSDYYLIAKMNDTEIAVKTEFDMAALSLRIYLLLKAEDGGIDILLTDKFNEIDKYRTYEVIKSEKDFIYRVLDEIEKGD